MLGPNALLVKESIIDPPARPIFLSTNDLASENETLLLLELCVWSSSMSLDTPRMDELVARAINGKTGLSEIFIR